MAHSKSYRTRAVSDLIFPVALGATIRPIVDSIVVGEWIVGYAPVEEDWQDDQSYDLGDTHIVDWLSNNINNARSQPPNLESVRHFLMRNGTFREWDWVTVEDALKSGLPNEVKAEVQRFKLANNAQIYVLRAEDFYRNGACSNYWVRLQGGWPRVSMRRWRGP